VPRNAAGSSLNVRKIFNVARDEQKSADEPARLLVAGAGQALRDFGDAAIEDTGLVAEAPTLVTEVAVRDVDLGQPLGLMPHDIVIVVTEGLSHAPLARLIREVHMARVPLVVALPVRDVAEATHLALAAGAFSTELEVYEPGLPLAHTRLADAVAAAAGAQGPMLAAGTPWLRPAVVARLVRRTAVENGFIGALIFVPGADMPIMTVNQIRMVLRVAVAYGYRVEPKRAPEILATVAAGLGWRALAHQGLKWVPAAGWAVKGAVGFTATVALGRAAAAYYSSGAAGKLGAMEVRLPESLERRLPGPVADVVTRRFGGDGSAVEADFDTPASLQSVINTAHDEPVEKEVTDVPRAEGDLPGSS